MEKRLRGSLGKAPTNPIRRSQSGFWRSIRVRFTVLYVSTILVLLIGGGFVLYNTAERIVMNETDEALTTRAARVLDAYFAHQPFLDLTELRDPNFHVGTVYPDFFYYGLFNVDSQSNKLLSSSVGSNPVLAETLQDAAKTQRPYSFVFFETRGYRWRILKYPVKNSNAVLVVATPWDPTEYRLLRLVMIMVGVFALVLFVSGFGSYTLIGRTLRPIDEIVTEAESMSVDRMTEQMLPENFATDIEIAHLIHALNGMVSRLNSVFNGQRQFIADASHEMRTPLTILRGEIELALQRERSSDEYKSVLISGLEETDRLTALVESLGLLARGDASGWRLADSQIFDCNRLLLGLTDAMQVAGNTYGISLSFLPSEETVEIRGDEGSLRRAFSNLIENGIHYTPRGGRVEVSTRVVGNWFEVVVSDTGVGMSEEDTGRIFDRFYRSVRTRTMSEGSGLGLSITLQTIKAHKGTIGVKSTLGQGSSFTVKLPLARTSLPPKSH